MKIIRGRLSAADVSNPNVRYNPGCDCMEITPDGGATWNPAPDLDPRHSAAFLKPPVAGTSKRCDAAANMVKWLHDFIDQMLFDFLLVGTVTTIINSILLELEILAPYIELLAIISELAETISGIGGTALAAAFTSDQYDLLLCIFYQSEDVNGQVNAAALATIETNITAQLNTTAALVTNAILFVQGEIGLSNAGAAGHEVGDCTACLPVWEFFPQSGFGDNHRGMCSGGAWVSTDNNTGGSGSPPSSSEIMMRITLPTSTLTRVSVTYSKSVGTNGTSNQDGMIIDSPNGWYNGTLIESVNPGVTHTTSPWIWTGSQAISGTLTLWMFAAAFITGSFGTITITEIEIDTSAGNFVWTGC